MNLFGLIIHGTTRGVDDLYVSENFKEIVQREEIAKTAIDERLLTTKLAMQSDVYTMQLTANYRVYSLIVTDIIDFVGRAGFYAIRIYVPKKYPLPNIKSLLHEINARYLEFESNGTPKCNQNYDDLFKVDLLLEVKQQDFLHLKSNEESYCYYDVTNSELSSTFNSKNVAFFNKIYAFNKEKAVASETIKALGLKSFEETKQNIRDIIISNHDRVLKELKINNVPIEFNSNQTELNLLTKEGDFLEYNTTDNPKFKQDLGVFITITKKNATKSERPKSPEEPNKSNFLAIYVVILLMMAALGVGSWFFILKKDVITKPISNTNPDTLPLEITFAFEGQKTDSVFKTKYTELQKYRFKYDNKKWNYKDTIKNKYLDFNLGVIEGFKLKVNEEIAFIKNLEKTSKQKIKKSEIKVIKNSRVVPTTDNRKKAKSQVPNGTSNPNGNTIKGSKSKGEDDINGNIIGN